jgi:hypothetical protein
MSVCTYHRIITFASILFVTAASALAQAPHTWTLDEDFDDGTMINVDNGEGDELRLSGFAAPLPFIYVAASQRGTVIKIDVNSGAILGEYLSAPDGMGRDPSRTTVDRYGNVWVANRAESGISGGESKGSITRIGVVLGGTRGTKNPDGSFTPDPAGEYLQPPFLYSTVHDRDGDGLIRTSSGRGNILAWPNADGANTHGGVSNAVDEAIINYTRVAGANTRTIAVDVMNDAWTGGTGDYDHEKIDGITGLPIPGTRFNVGCGGYGGLIDRNNVLWSAHGYENLLRYDASTPVPPNEGSVYTCLPLTHGDYGLGIDPQTGNIWHTTLTGSSVKVLAPDGTLIGSYPHGQVSAQGVAVDAVGNVWVAHSLLGGITTVGHLRTDGTYVGNVDLGVGVGPTGVAIDANGMVWVTNYFSNNVQRIDPNAGPIGGGGYAIGAVDLTVDIGEGAGPYNYSDMTGFVTLAGTRPAGTWTVVYDGTTPGTTWGTLSWTSETPTGCGITVEARAADNGASLAAEPFLTVANGESFCGEEIAGRYIEIRVRLVRSTDGHSPVVEDVTLARCNEPPVAVCHDVRIEAGADCLGAVAAADVDAGSYDPNGDALTLTLAPPGPYTVGVHEVVLTATDPSGGSSSCEATITVTDANDPTITLVDEGETWPPNHTYLTITVDDVVAAVSDPCDGSVDISDVLFVRGTSDEPEDAVGNGDGNTLDDIIIAPDCRSVQLRAERAGTGNGRVYRIYCRVTDASGNTSTASFPVGIRRNNGNGSIPIENAAVYVVDGACGDPTPKFVFAPRPPSGGFTLEQNIPNPFGTATEIPFSIGTRGHVTLTVHNELGETIATLVDGELDAGAYASRFDARGLPSGSYYCVLASNGVRLVRPMVLAR